MPQGPDVGLDMGLGVLLLDVQHFNSFVFEMGVGAAVKSGSWIGGGW